MANVVFDVLTNVPFDNQVVQSLLDCSTLVAEYEQTVIDQLESDIFQCGKCKIQFTSLLVFLQHKKEHSSKPPDPAVDVSPFIVNDPHICSDTIATDSTFDQQILEQNDQLNRSIILEENDMLFNIDQEDTSLNASSEFSVPIILSSDSLHTLEGTDLCSTKQLFEEDTKYCDIENDGDIEMDSTIHDDAGESSMNCIQSNIVQNLKYKCSYCEKQFAKKFYWQQHERSHTGEKPYQCVVCGRPFAQKSNVKKHMSSHKVWPGTAIHSLPPEAPADGSIDRTYHCQFCKEIFESYKALKGHLIVSHLTLKVYKCVQVGCSKMFEELDDFLEHTQSHKKVEYRCHVCGEAFSTLSDLGLHQYSHSIDKTKSADKYYFCSVCKSSFSNLKALQHHMDTTTHDYTCPHCNKIFLIERFLRRHLKTHASSAKFACDDCGKAFKTEQYLANHKLIHSEETPFHCTLCPARFKRKDRLGRHMLIHDLTKRLKCPYRNYLACMSEFSRPDKLKRHLLTHINVKKFNCSQCNRNLNRTQALKHHDVHKHGVKCELCLHFLKTKEQISAHNCDQAIGFKKQTSQLPKKLTGSFKPKKPTPKKQTSTKVVSIGIAEKEVKLDKLKVEKPKNKSAESQKLVINKTGLCASGIVPKPSNILILTNDPVVNFENFSIDKIEDD